MRPRSTAGWCCLLTGRHWEALERAGRVISAWQFQRALGSTLTSLRGCAHDARKSTRSPPGPTKSSFSWSKNSSSLQKLLRFPRDVPLQAQGISPFPRAAKGNLQRKTFHKIRIFRAGAKRARTGPAGGRSGDTAAGSGQGRRRICKKPRWEGGMSKNIRDFQSAEQQHRAGGHSRGAAAPSHAAPEPGPAPGAAL